MRTAAKWKRLAWAGVAAAAGLILAAAAGAAVRPAPAVYTVVIYPIADLTTDPADPAHTDPAAAREVPAQLMALIQTTVDPGGWTDPRASIGARPDGCLTIAQTDPGHQAVRDLLAALRQQRQTWVRLQARVFTYLSGAAQTAVTSAMAP